jgi:hypothetical protein
MSINPDELENDSALQAALEQFRASALAAVDRPDAFWDAQRRAVLCKVEQPRKGISWKPAVWATTVMVVALVAGIWLDGPRAAPAPDFAAGYDQDLLMDVERLTSSEMPLALEPAMLLAGEIEKGTRRATPAGTKLPRSSLRDEHIH